MIRWELLHKKILKKIWRISLISSWCKLCFFHWFRFIRCKNSSMLRIKIATILHLMLTIKFVNGRISPWINPFTDGLCHAYFLKILYCSTKIRLLIFSLFTSIPKNVRKCIKCEYKIILEKFNTSSSWCDIKVIIVFLWVA